MMKRSLILLAILLRGTSARPRTSLTSRDTIDQCAWVNTTLTLPLAPGYDYTFGNVASCLCLSNLTTWVQTDTISESAIEALGQGPVFQGLAGLIHSANYTNCTYPEQAKPFCLDSWPCSFNCTNGFTASPAINMTTCVCEPPNVVCNGICGDGSACSSKRAVAGQLESILKRDPGLLTRKDYHHTKRDLTAQKKEVQKRGRKLGEKLGCPREWEACGVFGGSRNAWECVDTTNDLESCGGCTIPITNPSHPVSVDDLITFGTDCTALPGVSDVECSRGACSVQACLPGWKVDRSGERCIRIQDDASYNAYDEWDDEGLSQLYDLKHYLLGENGH